MLRHNTLLKIMLAVALLCPTATTLASEAADPDSAQLAAATRWANSQMSKMSLEQKIGQLMFLRVPTNMTSKKQKEFDKTIEDYEPGGLCFFKGTATKQVEQTKHYQRISKTPLLITIDGEWGLGMRLTDCYAFPRQMLMGALAPANDTLIAQFGEEVGRQCRKMGIHINFAPVADINCNPSNPVIGCRSFGENKRRVAKKAVLYSRSMQRQGVMAVGKHFPGHGDTETDSHQDLPTISHPMAYIDSVDLFPFEKLIASGIRGMMVAHLQVNAYDNRLHMPSSLSDRIVHNLLRQRYHFDGLVFTDGIDMMGVAKYYKNGDGAIRAIRAGSDVILLPVDVKKTVEAVVKEAKRDKEFAKMIDDRCRRILREKYRCGLNNLQTDKLSAPDKKDLERSSKLTYTIATKALTLVKNDNYALPLEDNRKVVNVSISTQDGEVVVQNADASTNANSKKNKKEPADDTVLAETPAVDSTLEAQIRQAGTAVIHLYGTVGAANNYGVPERAIQAVNHIAALDSVQSILVIYGSPYILGSFAQPLPTDTRASVNAANAISNAINDYPRRPDAIVMAYQNLGEVRRAVTPALKGTNPFEGRLPVTTGNYKEGTSLKATPRPKTVDPYARLKEAGMNVECFRRIDSLAIDGIEQQAYPGCQILVARNGKIVYHRCYGHLTYEPNSPAVDTNTVYDIASLTKVSATTPAIMKLVDAGKISLDDPISKYVPYLKHTNKSKITVKEALSHCARLKSYDNYWKPAIQSSMHYGQQPPEEYVAIGQDVYIDPNYRDSVLKQIVLSELNKKQGYLYSDLGFILLAELVRYVSGQTLDLFASQQFYQPLNMRNTAFQPLLHGIDPARIAPTENETTFRRQALRGYVHDPNAAAMGGIAGHAGLFSTASDLFRLYQMYLNEGMLDGHRYLSEHTFNTFNSRHFANKNNRRALGFDKPFISSPSTHVSPKASQSSFGHTGFTGTMMWVDPQYGLVYIFLSNRVYPSATPNKLATMNIRTNIQDEIYLSMGVE